MVIVGGGPAGLFAAYKLASHADVTIIDAGRMPKARHCSSQQTLLCMQCDPCNMVAGFGGAGLLSSGLLNLTSDIGFPNYTLDSIGHAKTWTLIEEVDQVFLKHGAPEKSYDPDSRFDGWEKRAAASGLKFVVAKQRLIGTDNSQAIIQSLIDLLKKNDVKIVHDTKVKELEHGQILTNNGSHEFDKCLLAPGRFGMIWLAKVMEQHKVPLYHSPVDLGVRVEVPATIMNAICSLQRDPKILVRTDHYDDLVRTFCVNHNGYVVREQYETHACVNGHSFSNKISGNTNFAFLVRVHLTEPIEDTTKYAQTIAEQATLLGGGKPIVQRIADLMNHRRSTHERIKSANIVPTLRDVTPGDISMALPHRIVENVIEGLEQLDKVIPGVNSDSTILYAPEIKFYSMRFKANNDLETNIQNLFVAGDGAGLSRGIVASAATGIIAARGIVKKV